MLKEKQQKIENRGLTENGYNDKIKSSSWLILFLKKNETFQKRG